MSLFALAGPVQVAFPVLRNVSMIALGMIRPLFSLSIFFAAAMLFRPLIVGVLRAAIVLVKPRESFAVRLSNNHLRSVAKLNRMARDMDASQPNVAAELRAFAARD
jgi:hypothetical protein